SPPSVVAENQEGGAVGPDLDQGQAVEHGAHYVLANTEVQIASAGTVREEVAGALKRQPGLGGGRQVRRAAHQPWDVLGKNVEHLPGRVPRRQSLGVRREGSQSLIPAFRQLTMVEAIELVRQFWILCTVIFHTRKPGIAQFLSPFPDAAAKVVIDPI